MNLKARRSLWIALVLIALIYIFFPGYIQWEKARENLNYYQEKNEKLRQENLELKKEIWALKNDPLYIEQMTRKELGYAKEGEIIYEIERDEDSSER